MQINCERNAGVCWQLAIPLLASWRTRDPRVLDKTEKTTDRSKQDNPSCGTHPYRGRAAREYTTPVFMHLMEVNLGFELEHQFSWL